MEIIVQIGLAIIVSVVGFYVGVWIYNTHQINKRHALEHEVESFKHTHRRYRDKTDTKWCKTRIKEKRGSLYLTLIVYPYKGKNYHKLITSKTWTL